MKWVSSAVVGTLILIVLTATGCTGTRYARSTGRYVDDKAISAKVKTGFFNDPIVSAFQVHVQTCRGDVQLSGFVDTEQQRMRAEDIARGVEGVVRVTNDLIVKSEAVGGPGVDLRESDRDHAASADIPRERFAGPRRGVGNESESVPLPDVELTIKNGRAVINGRVFDDATRWIIERQVREMPVVKAVEDNLKVRPLAPVSR